MLKKRSMSDKALAVVAYVFATFMAILCLFPLLHTIALSFSDSAAAMAGNVVLWPVGFTVIPYKEILNDKQFFISFMNSIERVLVGVSINMLLIVITAFPLSRPKRLFPQKNIFMWFMVFNMLFSGGMIPVYLQIKRLGMLDTIWSLVLPGAVPIFSVIILMNYFKGLPEELDEAARIDGAGPYRILFQVFLPISLPSLATVGLMAVVGHWNAFFDGVIYINKMVNKPLSTYIKQLVMPLEAMNPALMSTEDIERMMKLSDKTFNAAKIFVTAFPILAIYPLLQRYFIKGLVMGSVKG